MAAELPPFAAEWARQWKEAAPKLQTIRDEELRRLDDDRSVNRDPRPGGVNLYDKYPERHGMVQMQRRLQRLHILQLTDRIRKLEAEVKRLSGNE